MSMIKKNISIRTVQRWFKKIKLKKEDDELWFGHSFNFDTCPVETESHLTVDKTEQKFFISQSQVFSQLNKIGQYFKLN